MFCCQWEVEEFTKMPLTVNHMGVDIVACPVDGEDAKLLSNVARPRQLRRPDDDPVNRDTTGSTPSTTTPTPFHHAAPQVDVWSTPTADDGRHGNDGADDDEQTEGDGDHTLLRDAQYISNVLIVNSTFMRTMRLDKNHTLFCRGWENEYNRYIRAPFHVFVRYCGPVVEQRG